MASLRGRDKGEASKGPRGSRAARRRIPPTTMHISTICSDRCTSLPFGIPFISNLGNSPLNSNSYLKVGTPLWIVHEKSYLFIAVILKNLTESYFCSALYFPCCIMSELPDKRIIVL